MDNWCLFFQSLLLLVCTFQHKAAKEKSKDSIQEIYLQIIDEATHQF